MKMENPRSFEVGRRAPWCAVFGSLCLFLSTFGTSADTVILHLKNGDRIAGTVTSEDVTNIVLETPWAKALAIPVEHLDRRETIASTPVTVTNAAPAITATPTKAPSPVPAPVPAEAVAAAKPVQLPAPGKWKTDVKLGADMIRGEKDRDIYYGQFGLTYAKPYESDPSKYFRNKLDYRVDYGTTDGARSSNRMTASDKTDFDYCERSYAYNNVAGGYDQVRKIDAQFEAGPGLGYHLLRKPAFVANVESGLTYQFQDRIGSDELESVYARFGQDVTWKIYPKITLTQRAFVLISTEEAEQLQFRMEANLAFGIVHNLSLNLTATELYDTRPVPGVTRNEFQLRSSLGITF